MVFRVVQVMEWLHKLRMHPMISGIIGIVHTVRLSDLSGSPSLVQSSSNVLPADISCRVLKRRCSTITQQTHWLQMLLRSFP